MCDSDILDGLVCHIGPDVLDLAHNIHAIDNLSKDHMLAIEMRERYSSDEELAAICVWTRVLVTLHVSSLAYMQRYGCCTWKTYCHREQASDIMFQIEVFISKGLCTVNRSRASAIAIEEVASLEHEIRNLSIC